MTYTIEELLTRSYGEWRTAADKLVFDTRPFIDGAFTDATSGEVFPSTSPRDGRVLAEVQAASAEDVDRAGPYAAPVPPSRTAAGVVSRPKRASGSCCAGRS